MPNSVIRPDGLVYNSLYRQKGSVNKPSHITIGTHTASKNDSMYGTRYPNRMERYEKNPLAISRVNTKTGETLSVDPHPFSLSSINRWNPETGNFSQNKERVFVPLGDCSYKEFKDVIKPDFHPCLDDLAHKIGFDSSKL